MMLSQPALKAFGSVLSSTVTTYHYWRPQLTPPFAIWAETGARQMSAGNIVVEQSITGTLDYYTQTEYDSKIDDIQAALNSMDNVSWSLQAAQYDPEMNVINYTWNWELIANGEV